MHRIDIDIFGSLGSQHFQNDDEQGEKKTVGVNRRDRQEWCSLK